MIAAGCAESPRTAEQEAVADQIRSDADKAEQEEAEIRKALAELPSEHRKLAEAQLVCPVGGGRLGSMGMPYLVSIKDRDILLCCEGCKGAIESDPDKYLATLDRTKPQ
jgi:hypothetical protein